MEWTMFVQMVLSNPWLLLSWEFLSSALAAVLVYKLTGHKIDVKEIRGRMAKTILGSEATRSLRERIAERIAGRPLEKSIEFKEAENGKVQA